MPVDSLAFYVSILRKHFLAYCSQRFAEFGVTYSQLFVLIYIGKRNECSPKEISELLKLDAGQLNRTLCKLQKKGLVEQRKNLNDRRSNIVCLTLAGQKIFEDSHTLFLEWDQIVLSQIDAACGQNLLSSLQIIVSNLEMGMEEHKVKCCKV